MLRIRPRGPLRSALRLPRLSDRDVSLDWSAGWRHNGVVGRAEELAVFDGTSAGESTSSRVSAGAGPLFGGVPTHYDADDQMRGQSLAVSGSVSPVGSKHREGFTLIELLVVIAIIAVLIALLLARGAGRPRGRATDSVRQ